MLAIPIAAATFALVIHWAVGLAVSVALADTEEGLIRDHPLFGRRLCSLVVPLMAVIGLSVPTLLGASLGRFPPAWVLISVALMLPFAGISWLWSRTWIGRHPASKRRRLGIWTVAAGLLGAFPVSLIAAGSLEPAWRGVIPFMIFAGGVGLPGSLTNLSIMALTAGLPQEVPGGQIHGVAGLTGFGLLSNLLVFIDLSLAWMESGKAWPAAAVGLGMGWALCAVALPGSILLARARWRHMQDSLIMPAALTLALAGQWMAYYLVFRHPGLVPPIVFE